LVRLGRRGKRRAGRCRDALRAAARRRYAPRGRESFHRCAPGAHRRGPRRRHGQRNRAAPERRLVPGLEGAAPLRCRGRRFGYRRSQAASRLTHRARRSPAPELRRRRRHRLCERSRMTAAAPATARAREPLDPVAWLALPAVVYLLFVYAVPLLLLLA